MMRCDANEAWSAHITNIAYNGKDQSPRGKLTREIVGVSTGCPALMSVVTDRVRDIGYKFLCAEAWWILTGRRDVKSIKPYAPGIEKFSDDGMQFDGAYGPMISEQLRYIIDSFVNDVETRQAVLTIWRPNPRKSRDIPCTVSLQFIIRDNQLHCVANMRSSDAWLGWVYDVFNFSMITAYICLHLRDFFIDVTPGDTIIQIGSAHIYHSDMNKIMHKNLSPVHYEGIPFNSLSHPGDLIHKLWHFKDNPRDFKSWIKLHD